MLKERKLRGMRKEGLCWSSKQVGVVLSKGKRQDLVDVCVTLVFHVLLRHFTMFIQKFIRGYFPGYGGPVLKRNLKLAIVSIWKDPCFEYLSACVLSVWVRLS